MISFQNEHFSSYRIKTQRLLHTYSRVFQTAAASDSKHSTWHHGNSTSCCPMLWFCPVQVRIRCPLC